MLFQDNINLRSIRLSNRLHFVLVMLIMLSCSSERYKEPDGDTRIAIAGDQAKKWAKEIRESVAAELDTSLELTLWAPDTLLADPVALDMDDHGRAFVTRTNRRRTSEFDIRRHREWELKSMSFKSVEDRRAFLRKTLTPEECEKIGKPLDLNEDGVTDWKDLMVESEQVYRVEDSDSDGVADVSTLVASGFNEEVTDIAGGVHWTEDALFLSVAPDLWKLKDTNGDGVMDDRESLSHGWQVHIGFGGHNLSGVTMGPDGRIYWGIGDIGFSGTDRKGKKWSYPNEGVIARCEPDGSNFEIFARGLRNTHEFVFDQFGNLISVDNDGDHPGESERLVYITQDSDQGWRINWQFGKYNDPKNNKYKVWMDEGMYLPRHKDQAAYFMPCIRNYINGPTGMIFNPGTALGSAWNNWFFVVEFNGNPARSGIHAFQLQPEGAGMTFVRDKKILSGVLATGLDVGSDGSLYFTDWIDGWEKKGIGRIWKLTAKNSDLKEIQKEVQELLRTDFSTMSGESVSELLWHEDMRVRKKSQFNLVNREAVDILDQVFKKSSKQFARLHALWGLGQLARAGKLSGDVLEASLADSDTEVVAQACKIMGDIRHSGVEDILIKLLRHESSRVQFFAMEALGKLGAENAFEPIIALVEQNDDRDLYLRHTACIALSRVGTPEALARLASSEAKAVRTAAVVALRRVGSPRLADFLADGDDYIVAEAARAINDDLSVEAALPSLGDLLLNKRFDSEVIVRRAINANLRVGTPVALQNLLSFASDLSRSESMRVEALAAIATWLEPSVVDRVDGYYRGEFLRDASAFSDKFGQLVPLLEDQHGAVRLATVEAIQALDVRSARELIVDVLKKDASADVRAEALRTLVFFDQEKSQSYLKDVLRREKGPVRIAAIKLLDKMDMSSDIGESLEAVLLDGSSAEKQAVIGAFEHLPPENVEEHLSLLMDQLMADEIDGSLQLNLLSLAEGIKSEEITEKVRQFRAKHKDLGVAAEYIECLEGGAIRPGAITLYANSAAQCLKCHQVNGTGGVAGPSLNGVATRLTKIQILQSIVEPNLDLSPGYGVVTVTLDDGQTISGILMSESEQSLVIRDSDAKENQVDKSKVTERINALSSMPDMRPILSKSEIRDLIAFLSTLKGEEN